MRRADYEASCARWANHWAGPWRPEFRFECDGLWHVCRWVGPRGGRYAHYGLIRGMAARRAQREIARWTRRLRRNARRRRHDRIWTGRALVSAPLLVVALFAGCKTPTHVARPLPAVYVVCDDGGHNNCNGTNPEKGIPRACLPAHRYIRAVVPGHDRGELLVLCGPTIPR